MRYDEWYSRNRITAENEVKALKALGLKGLGLEIGVGTGFFASKLNIRYGIDPSVNMIKLARDRGIEVIAGYGEYLPFRDQIFDFIAIIVTLCFVNDPLSVLRESWRVLKYGGLIAVCIIPKDSEWGKYYRMFSRSPFYRVAKFYSTDEVKSMLDQLNFKVLKCVSTLNSYGPKDRPKYEEPKFNTVSGGFVCLLAKKV